jgi:RND family efflux transporter MFP subunit
MPQGGRTLEGRVSFVLPQFDPTTRTLKVRIETPNPGLSLRPDMYLDVDFDLGAGAARVTVPAGAVLDSGTRQVVFVDRGNGYLEQRQVTVGERSGDRVVIDSGLAAGERVVASGTFLIDSESQLRAATAPAEAAPPEREHRRD